jgi:hypothetical protein
MADYDPRLTLIRNGVASAALEGVVPAARYVETTAWHCMSPTAAIRKTVESDSEQLDQLIFGEVFDVLEVEGAFAFGQARRDGYVGYVYRAALASGVVEPTHWVSALRTYAFSKPDIKSQTVGLFTLNSLMKIKQVEGRFGRAEGTGWIVLDHLTPVGVYADEATAVAEAFREAPYQWGGRESAGLDCSGLVQQALYAAGKGALRDTDLQAGEGAVVAASELVRGDLVFWKGHVAMMTDGATILHANARDMAARSEPLAVAVERIGEPTAYRRP